MAQASSTFWLHEVYVFPDDKLHLSLDMTLYLELRGAPVACEPPIPLSAVPVLPNISAAARVYFEEAATRAVMHVDGMPTPRVLSVRIRSTTLPYYISAHAVAREKFLVSDFVNGELLPNFLAQALDSETFTIMTQSIGHDVHCEPNQDAETVVLKLIHALMPFAQRAYDVLQELLQDSRRSVFPMPLSFITC